VVQGPDEASNLSNEECSIFATAKPAVAADPATSGPEATADGAAAVVDGGHHEREDGDQPNLQCEDEEVDEHTPLLSSQCGDQAATSTAPVEATGTHGGEEVSVQVTPARAYKRFPRKQGTRGDRDRYILRLQEKAEAEKRDGINEGMRANAIAKTQNYEPVGDQYSGAILEAANASQASNDLIKYVGACSAEFEAYRALGERLGRHRHIPDRTDAEDNFHLRTVWRTYSRAGHSRGGTLLTIVGFGLLPILYEVADVIVSVVGPWQMVEGVVLFGARHLVSLFITGYYIILTVYIINLLWDYRITIVAPRLFESGEQVLVTTSAGLEEDNRPYSNKVGTPELPALYVGVNSVDTTLLWFLIDRAITLLRCDVPYTTVASFWGGGMRMVRDSDGVVTTSLARFSEIRTVLSYELLLQLGSPRIQVCSRWTDVVAQALQSVRREVCINSDVNILNRFDAVDQTTLQYALIRHVTSGSRARMESFEHLN
jgi:hypothetical protein